MIVEQDYFERRILHPTRSFTWSGWRAFNSRPLDPQIGGSHYAALPERAGPMKAARKRLGVLPRSVCGAQVGPKPCGRRWSWGLMVVSAVGFAMCARRYASGAAESAAISARAAATSSLLVWA